MFLPVLLLFTATLAAAFAAYGTSSQWAVIQGGMDVIQWSRRLQWPLVTLAVLCCLTLLVLIIIGKRKPWWLIGFAPVLALFLHLFVTGSNNEMEIADQPPLVPASKTNFVADDEYVVGVKFEDRAIALPYRQLYRYPVVILSERGRRAAVLWSAPANRAVAFQVNHQVLARELDVVSMPANALLVYNRRIGEFINGVTGLTPAGQAPYGFTHRLQTYTMPWWQWRALHPDTSVTSMPTLSTALSVPAAPHLPMRLSAEDQKMSGERVILLSTTPPIAIRDKDVTPALLNLDIGEVPIVIHRQEETGQIKAFERNFAGQASHFIANPSPQRTAKGVVMVDLQTNTGWTSAGVAVDGDRQIVGQRLKPYTSFDEGQYYGVLKAWYPQLKLITPEDATPRG